MTKALDYLIIVVVALFIIILIVIGFRSCGNLMPKTKDKPLETEVTMGDNNTLSTDGEQTDSTLNFESEGIDPDVVDSLSAIVDAELADSNADDVNSDGSNDSDQAFSSSEEEDDPAPSDTRTNTSPAKSSSGPAFFVISGSYLMEENAKSEVKKLKSMGYPAEVLEFAKSEYYTVCVKQFSKRSDADSFKSKILTDKGIKSYVLKQRFK